jgi:hypothetical protein
VIVVESTVDLERPVDHWTLPPALVEGGRDRAGDS